MDKRRHFGLGIGVSRSIVLPRRSASRCDVDSSDLDSDLGRGLGHSGIHQYQHTPHYLGPTDPRFSPRSQARRLISGDGSQLDSELRL